MRYDCTVLRRKNSVVALLELRINYRNYRELPAAVVLNFVLSILFDCIVEYSNYCNKELEFPDTDVNK